MTLAYAVVIGATLWGAAAVVLWPGSVVIVAVAAFVGIMGAAFLISIGAEVSEFFIAQGLAIAAITLFETAPEMAVESAIAYQGKVALMLANFTGSNRLLMGAGWPLIYVVAAVTNRQRHGQPLAEIRLRPENILETLFLVAPSVYLLFVVAKDTLTLLDSVVLAGMFVAYLALLNRLPPEEEESKEDVLPIARRLLEMPFRKTVILTLLLILVGGGTILLVAEPFVNSLQGLALATGVSAFFFIQWVAPFLSEFPESLIAFYWARRLRLAPMALLNLVASKINQWTLLILFIPVFYSLGLGHLAEVRLGAFQAREILLTVAMTAYGAVVLLKRSFTASNAALLFTLWFFQFLFPATFPGTGVDVRDATAVGFLLLAVVELALHRREIHPLRDLRTTAQLMRAHSGAHGTTAPEVPADAATPSATEDDPRAGTGRR